VIGVPDETNGVTALLKTKTTPTSSDIKTPAFALEEARSFQLRDMMQ
jgi:hypothetical protein